LNGELTRFSHEKQIFRIDHYLGKETVQNILTFRFSNAIFERLWNREAIDHVQITVAEKLGVGSRGGYYEEAGAMRDMLQNHVLQVLALIAMEPPASLEAENVRDEKVKLLKSIRPMTPAQVAENVVRGQYFAGEVEGELRPAYRSEPKVKPNSSVETFVAMRLLIDNWRWSGVPFYLRTGKNLPLSASEVRIQFKPVPSILFNAQHGSRLDANSLTLRLQPNEGMTLRFNGKVPGGATELRPVRMNFSYDTEFGAYTPEAYERLLLEAMAGDATLFIRRDEVEAAWAWVDPILEAWSLSKDAPKPYTAGTWGPSSAVALIEREGRTWHDDGG
jgi:glucose-6-phosphate 1-dehydrogenase